MNLWTRGTLCAILLTGATVGAQEISLPALDENDTATPLVITGTPSAPTIDLGTPTLTPIELKPLNSTTLNPPAVTSTPLNTATPTLGTVNTSTPLELTPVTGPSLDNSQPLTPVYGPNLDASLPLTHTAPSQQGPQQQQQQQARPIAQSGDVVLALSGSDTLAGPIRTQIFLTPGRKRGRLDVQRVVELQDGRIQVSRGEGKVKKDTITVSLDAERGLQNVLRMSEVRSSKITMVLDFDRKSGLIKTKGRCRLSGFAEVGIDDGSLSRMLTKNQTGIRGWFKRVWRGMTSRLKALYNNMRAGFSQWRANRNAKKARKADDEHKVEKYTNRANNHAIRAANFRDKARGTATEAPRLKGDQQFAGPIGDAQALPMPAQQPEKKGNWFTRLWNKIF